MGFMSWIGLHILRISTRFNQSTLCRRRCSNDASGNKFLFQQLSRPIVKDSKPGKEISNKDFVLKDKECKELEDELNDSDSQDDLDISDFDPSNIKEEKN